MEKIGLIASTVFCVAGSIANMTKDLDYAIHFTLYGIWTLLFLLVIKEKNK